MREQKIRLNPYSNGIWSTRVDPADNAHKFGVLILILMEYDLRGTKNFRSSIRAVVLILILMEYDLRDEEGYHQAEKDKS